MEKQNEMTELTPEQMGRITGGTGGCDDGSVGNGCGPEDNPAFNREEEIQKKRQEFFQRYQRIQFKPDAKAAKRRGGGTHG